ncbi:MAG: NAD-dependent epimerase/dehydratase family protein [Pseudomonadota bacterium]
MAILITGAAGFIGYHTTLALLARGDEVVGIDNLNSYYDVALKRGRLQQLEGKPGFRFLEADLADGGAMATLRGEPIDRIIHLGAQAGVRHSIDEPLAYAQSNLIGQTEILELARSLGVKHCVYASSSSVYGRNSAIPFSESDRTDSPASFYGATKKSGEVLADSYAALYSLPLTGLRFFTVYGPWGRPDMAYMIFTRKILAGDPISVFGQGDMGRDFTYIDDCVDGIIRALDHIPAATDGGVPHRIFNLGNDKPERLGDFIGYLEEHLGKTATKEMKPMQPGDVRETWANITKARELLGYDPKTSLKDGLGHFIAWYRSYYTA